jgi:deoxycytidylate deaminase
MAMTGLGLIRPQDEAASGEGEISPLSLELVIGVVGYVGAGCSTACNRLKVLLQQEGYQVEVIKLSRLIARHMGQDDTLQETHGIGAGSARFHRASRLQDSGDTLREQHGHDAVAALAIAEIRALRGHDEAGLKKRAFILDSLKHSAEVDLLRKVYDQSFRLVAVHCDRPIRENRLVGGITSTSKYAGVEEVDVLNYMDRDEKDHGRKNGQQVRDAFYLADFFIDNNLASQSGASLTGDLHRFVNLVLGSGLVRPTKSERAMYHAHAAALQSSCLSRQVGAALVALDGTVVATGTNDVPKFGGGVYDEDSEPDHRCFAWEWTDGSLKFKGCHNQRKKNKLREDIGAFLAEKFSKGLALAAHPQGSADFDPAAEARDKAERRIREFFADNAVAMADLPGIKDIVEYSRSIHAEMNALLSAARNGISPVGTTLYCTTYPCHNCARHLVTAGVTRVYYIEPYVKSLATELHSDAIATQTPPTTGGTQPKQTHMVVTPFTGVGPRMYEDFFAKRTEVKRADGTYEAPDHKLPAQAVRLRELRKVEERAAALIQQVPNV